jgi:hypothetical protein
VAGIGYGGGGGGAAGHNAAASAVGGAGSPGLCIITEYGMTALASGASLGNVRYDLPQGLTVNQMAQARSNTGVTKRNYILNGAMQISQENGSTVGTTNGYYGVDQFSTSFTGTSGTLSNIGQAAAITPAGSPNRLFLSVGTTDASVGAGDLVWVTHRIEGLRAADLRWGTAAAKTVIIQFGVNAPAGTYCVSARNAAANRSYVAEFTVAAGEAGTDVVKSVVVPGDTSGTWAKDNTVGIELSWTLMCGSTFQTPAGSWVSGNFIGSANQLNWMGAANVFHLFDVGLYEGSVAPPFMVPDYAVELRLCQRYWETDTITFQISGAGSAVMVYPFKATKRAAPTIALSNTTGNMSAAVLNYVTINSLGYQFTGPANGFSGATYIINARL